MRSLRIIVPLIVTVILTVLAILSAIWLAGLIPAGPWAELIKAGIVIFIIGTTLLVIAWSAYFTFVIREAFEKSLSNKD